MRDVWGCEGAGGTSGATGPGHGMQWRSGVGGRWAVRSQGLDRGRGRPARPAAEDHGGGQRRPADPVAAMNAAGGLSGGPQARHLGPAVDVDFDAAEPGMAARRDLEGGFGNVDAAVQACLVNVGDLFLDRFHGNFSGVHEDAAGQSGASGVNFLGHGENDLASGTFFRCIGEIAFQEFLA